MDSFRKSCKNTHKVAPCNILGNRIFLRRFTSGGIFNNRLLFKENKILFPYCFLEIFVGGQGLDGGGQSCDRRGSSPPPLLGKTLGK